MDAPTFYGAPNIQNHGRSRCKPPNSVADRLFTSTLNGDVSDADLSDYEENEIDPVGAVNDDEDVPVASSDEAEIEETGDDERQPPSKKSRMVKWCRKKFEPDNIDCVYQPRGASPPMDSLKNFECYFTNSVFEELTKYTNVYYLQKT
ncbi:hypothetical protein V5799_027411, partial [Amblyomma americanum]